MFFGRMSYAFMVVNTSSLPHMERGISIGHLICVSLEGYQGFCFHALCAKLIKIHIMLSKILCFNQILLPVIGIRKWY